MPVTHRLYNVIAIDDIISWGTAPEFGEVTFLFSKTCFFEPGAEGLALSYVAGLIENSRPISIVCEFGAPHNERDFFSSALSSIFSYALIRACHSVRFIGSDENQREIIRVFSGRIYDKWKGVVGLGDEVRLIAFDPKRPAPRVLLTSLDAIDNNSGMPLPSAFHRQIMLILRSMGLHEIGSPTTLPSIVQFVHELFLNTFQHGIPNAEHIARHSTRGIALTKIAYNVQHLPTRRISKNLREFLERIAEIQKRKNGLIVLCISVMDMGDGIQHTLPPLNSEESDFDRLFRAFGAGQSRKNGGIAKKGEGLHRVVEAAFRLGARLQISSANKMLIKDFSFGEDKFPTLSGSEQITLPSYFNRGTSLELFVPQFVLNIDQRELAV